MCFIELLLVLLIISVASFGLGDPYILVIVGLAMLPIMLVVFMVRNRVSDFLVSTFLGGGEPPISAAEIATDRADGFVAQHEYDAALYTYEEALRRAKYPQHKATITMKLAETAQLAQRWDEALRWWEAALKLRKGLSEDQRARALFRMAEIVHEHKHDLHGAARLLARVRTEYPGTPYARYAEDRLRTLASNR